MLRYEVVEPQADVVNSGLIIMPNEIMAGLGDYHTARAHDVADLTGMPVLAYERPFSASQRIFSLSERRNITHNAAQIQASTARELGRAIDLETGGNLYVTGHSGGASEAIGITASDVLPVKHLVVTDPAAIRRSTPIKAEAGDYGIYTIFVDRDKPKDIDNHPPKKHPTGFETVTRTLGEICTYSAYWRSKDSKTALMYILGNQPETAVNVYFPEFTFTAKPEYLREFAEELNDFRDNFKAEVLPGLYHSYFNDYKRFARLLAKSLGLRPDSN